MLPRFIIPSFKNVVTIASPFLVRFVIVMNATWFLLHSIFSSIFPFAWAIPILSYRGLDVNFQTVERTIFPVVSRAES